MHPHGDIYIVICPAEPHQGDGGLLRRPHEALRRAEDRATDPQRARLHRLHPHPFPKLEALAFRSVPTRDHNHGTSIRNRNTARAQRAQRIFPVPILL